MTKKKEVSPLGDEKEVRVELMKAQTEYYKTMTELLKPYVGISQKFGNGLKYLEPTIEQAINKVVVEVDTALQKELNKSSTSIVGEGRKKNASAEEQLNALFDEMISDLMKKHSKERGGRK